MSLKLLLTCHSKAHADTKGISPPGSHARATPEDPQTLGSSYTRSLSPGRCCRRRRRWRPRPAAKGAGAGGAPRLARFARSWRHWSSWVGMWSAARGCGGVRRHAAEFVEVQRVQRGRQQWRWSWCGRWRSLEAAAPVHGREVMALWRHFHSRNLDPSSKIPRHRTTRDEAKHYE